MIQFKHDTNLHFAYNLAILRRELVSSFLLKLISFLYQHPTPPLALTEILKFQYFSISEMIFPTPSQYHELASEAFYLMAIVYDKLGQYSDRDDAASSFRKHITAFENPEETDDSLLSKF